MLKLGGCIVLLASAFVVSGPSGSTAAVAAETKSGGEEAAEVRELLRMCCWADGRAGFQYCAEYGVCKSRPEATCAGRGAAEGLTLDCGAGADRTMLLLPGR